MKFRMMFVIIVAAGRHSAALVYLYSVSSSQLNLNYLRDELGVNAIFTVTPTTNHHPPPTQKLF